MLLKRRNTVALSLGGGGARGYAHIGAIKEIEAQGLEITAIAGTSMGAVVGTLFAAGKLNEFEKWARKLTPIDVLASLRQLWGLADVRADFRFPSSILERSVSK